VQHVGVAWDIFQSPVTGACRRSADWQGCVGGQEPQLPVHCGSLWSERSQLLDSRRSLLRHIRCLCRLV